MKLNYLFPNKFKTIGWVLFILSAIALLLTQLLECDPNVLTLNVPSIFAIEFGGEKRSFGVFENNLLDEILSVLVILSGLLVAFSEEKQEDEYISKIRLDSLVWAVYVNYGILLFSIVFIYDLSFYWVMQINMFTVMLFFIIRFNWQISKLKRSVSNEE